MDECFHLQTEETDDRLVVTDAILHFAGVQVLFELQGILCLLLHLFKQRCIRFDPVFIVLISREHRSGSQPPQNPVRPGRFPLLTADQVSTRKESLVGSF